MCSEWRILKLEIGAPPVTRVGSELWLKNRNDVPFVYHSPRSGENYGISPKMKLPIQLK